MSCLAVVWYFTIEKNRKLQFYYIQSYGIALASWVPPPGGPMFLRVITCLSFLILAGCASTQLNYNTLEIAGTIDSTYTKEALNNLSKFVDNPYAIPSQVILGGGLIQTTNAITPSVTFPLTPQIAQTATGTLSSLSLASTGTIAGAGAGLSGTNSAQQQYQVLPLNDANTLRNQQALYRHAVYGTPLVGAYRTHTVFFANKFYEDPYLLQLPHCVLCAIRQGTFSPEKPRVYENPALPGKWLYWSDDLLGEALSPRDEFLALGRFGNHNLFMRKADYAAGVLSNFVLFTLPNTAPVETFVAFQTKEETAKGEITRSETRVVPSTNSRIVPAERQQFLFPQTILPAQ
jgi:hypothetical protein